MLLGLGRFVSSSPFYRTFARSSLPPPLRSLGATLRCAAMRLLFFTFARTEGGLPFLIGFRWPGIAVLGSIGKAAAGAGAGGVTRIIA